MTDIEIAAIIRKEIRDAVKEELENIMVPHDSRFMSIPEAAIHFNVDAGWLRNQCKSGMDGAFIIGNGKKYRQYRIDPMKARQWFETRGIITRKRKNQKTIAL